MGAAARHPPKKPVITDVVPAPGWERDVESDHPYRLSLVVSPDRGGHYHAAIGLTEKAQLADPLTQ
jgi:hypothetical protein